MSIKADLIELENLKKEISMMTKKLHECRKQKSQVEERIITFMKTQDMPGLKNGDNTAVILTQKKMRNKKNQEEKIKDITNVFQKYGINILDEKMIKDIFDAQKGNFRTNETLKFFSTK